MSDAFAIPFSIVWAGFALFWEVSVVRSGAPWFFAAFGVPFVVIGAYLSVGRFFVDSYLRKHTHYALTDRRALILTTWPMPRVRSVNLAALAEVQLIGERNGAGTLIFGSRAWDGKGSPKSPRFEWIDDVRSVYRLATEGPTTPRA